MHSRSLAFLRDLEENLQRGRSETTGTESKEPSQGTASTEAQAALSVPGNATSIRSRLAKLFTKTKRQGADVNDANSDADSTNGDLGPTVAVRDAGRLRRALATVTLGNGLTDTSVGVQFVAVPVAPPMRGTMSNSFSASRTLNRNPSITSSQPAGTSTGAALVPSLRNASTSRGMASRVSMEAQRPGSRYTLDRTASIAFYDPGSPVPVPATSVTTPGLFPELSPPSQTQPRSAAARRASTGTAAWAAAMGAAAMSQPGTSATESHTCCSPISSPFPPGLDSPRGHSGGPLRTLRLSTKQVPLYDDFDTPGAAALLSEFSSPFNTDEVVHVPSAPPTVALAAPPATAPAVASPNSRSRLFGRPGSVRAASTGSAASYYLPPGVHVAPADDDNSEASGDMPYIVDVAAAAAAATGSSTGSTQSRLQVALSGASFSSRRGPPPPHHYQQQQQQAQLLQSSGHGSALEPTRPARNRPLPFRSTSFAVPKASVTGASSPVALYGSGGGGAGSPVAYGGGGGRGGSGLSASMRRTLGQNDSMRRLLGRQGSMAQSLMSVGGGEGEDEEGEELAEGVCQPMMSPRALRARGRSAMFLGTVH